MRKKFFFGLLLMAFFSMAAVTNASVKSSEYIYDCYAQIATYSGGRVNISFNISGTDQVNIKNFIAHICIYFLQGWEGEGNAFKTDI